MGGRVDVRSKPLLAVPGAVGVVDAEETRDCRARRLLVGISGISKGDDHAKSSRDCEEKAHALNNALMAPIRAGRTQHGSLTISTRICVHIA